MEHGFEKLPSGDECERILLYPGIDLCYMDVVSNSFSTHHEALGHIMQINYCKAGQVVWKTQSGTSIFLNPGDFSVHTLDSCMDSSFHFPTGQYQSLTIYIDLREASAHPPELIAETEIFSGLLRESFARIIQFPSWPETNGRKASFQPFMTNRKS